MSIPYFDAHCDTISQCRNDGRSLRKNSGNLDLVRLKKYDKAVQFFAIFHRLKDAPKDGMFEECKRQCAVFNDEINKNNDIVMQCRNADDINSAILQGKIAAVLTCEGSELLNCDLENLDWARDNGVKAINLTWNYANLIAGSNISEVDRGLNDWGRAFVKKAQDYDILIDVSHCSDKAFWDLIDITTKPIIASHSNSRAICSHSRNLTDEMFCAIIKTGGIVGINYWVKFVAEYDEQTFDDIIKHIDHFVELGGIKNIGLGGDLDGCDKLTGGMIGVEDVEKLWDALINHGYSKNECEDIFFNNWMRVIK